MGTRSHIVYDDAHEYKYMYVQMDGYISHQGVLLQQNINKGNIEKLFSHLCPIDVLSSIQREDFRKKSQTKKDYERFYNATHNVIIEQLVVKYRKESDKDLYGSFSDRKDIQNYCGEEYVYLFEKGKWLVSDNTNSFVELKPLVDICEKGKLIQDINEIEAPEDICLEQKRRYSHEFINLIYKQDGETRKYIDAILSNQRLELEEIEKSDKEYKAILLSSSLDKSLETKENSSKMKI